MTPADTLGERAADPFCGNEVLGAIHQLADATHSKPIGDLVDAGTYRPELLMTLGKSAAPRYANFIGRFKDDRDPAVRRAVATALGSIDNDAIAIPVLIQLLARPAEDFFARWAASESLIRVGKRRANETLRRRVRDLLAERDGMTVTLAARVLAALGESRGVDRLRQLTTDADARVRKEALLALGDLADTGAREAVTRRLKDDNVAVRAVAVWALGRIAGKAAEPALRTAVQEALAYEQDLERRKGQGETEESLRAKFGVGEYDLRATLDEAVTAR